MLNLFKRDFILMRDKSSSKLVMLILVIPLIITILGAKNISEPLLLSLGYIVLFLSINFEDEDTNTHIAMGYLPIYNWEIVLQQYLFTFINYVLGIIYIFLVLFILNVLGLEHIKYVNINLLLRISFLIFLASSIILPLYFWLTNRWFNFWTTIILIISMNISRGVLEGDSVFNDTKSITLLIIIFGMYILSLILSLYIYKNRDIG